MIRQEWETGRFAVKTTLQEKRNTWTRACRYTLQPHRNQRSCLRKAAKLKQEFKMFLAPLRLLRGKTLSKDKNYSMAGR